MQDTRVRLLATIILSVAAFLSVFAAILVFFWWLVCTPGIRALQKSRYGLLIILFSGIISVLIWFSGGDGLSYFIRMTVILLIAFWVFHDRAPGEFMDLSVWLFGKKTGFDIGLAAEMSIQSIEFIGDEITRLRFAFRLKPVKPGMETIVPAAGMLIHTQMKRADDQADLLSMRGYSGGGTICPVFRRGRGDIPAAILSILILIVSFIPVRDIFILLQ
jgi:energy-coupling factor transport system permease protein